MSLFDYAKKPKFVAGKGLGSALADVGDWIGDRWRDFTGVTAVEEQNKANLELAKYQAQINEDFYNKYSSPDALMRQYREAGLNPNLVYGSASAGQSNVPSFDAPHVERNMSGSDKLNKALSVMSAVQGIMQGQYQTVAAREAAEQSAIKTLNDKTIAFRNALDYATESEIVGLQPSLGIKPFFKRSSLGRLKPSVSAVYGDGFSDFQMYSRAAREGRINNWMRSGAQNLFDFGVSIDPDYKALSLPSGIAPYMQYRNNNLRLRYELDDELRRLGVYGRLGLAAARLFF